MEELTSKQKAFLKAYLSNGMNATEAARTAGYQGSDGALAVAGNRALNNDKIKKFLDEAKRDFHKEIGVTVETVLRDLKQAKEWASKIYYDGQGNKRRDIAAYTRATELEGKYLKMFTDRIEHVGDPDAPLSININFKKPDE